MNLFILNAFSLSMLQELPSVMYVEEIEVENVKRLIDTCPSNQINFISAIGHENMSIMLTDVLERHIALNRISVYLEKSDRCIIAQYNGPRLPEGATTLPDNASIKWLLVTIGE